jgi:hypothetical protein
MLLKTLHHARHLYRHTLHIISPRSTCSENSKGLGLVNTEARDETSQNPDETSVFMHKAKNTINANKAYHLAQ